MTSPENAYATDPNRIFASVPVPAHVPADLVVDFDYRHPAGLAEGDVYSALKRLHDGPDIVWTPRNGGHWVLTRAADIQWVQENYEVFSHEEFVIPRGVSPIKMPPLTVDPPLHARYRAVINPAFTPKRVGEMKNRVRELTIELIENILPKGRCEFVNDFARIMPVIMFLEIVDLPLTRRKDFVDWGVAFMRAEDMTEKVAAQARIVEYLTGVIAERSANPGVDLLSRIAGWRNNSRFEGEHEIIGMALLIFFGGLDTVANLLSFTALHLAQHPGHVLRLREDPAVIPQAAEEYIRRFGLSNTGRLVKRDLDYKGVTFLKDEMVMVPIGLSSMDDRLYPDPLTVDFDRNAPSHNTFGNGPHKCVGSPLARVELQIFLEEWSRRMPDFRLDPGLPPVTHAGSVNGVDSLHLTWDL